MLSRSKCWSISSCKHLRITRHLYVWPSEQYLQLCLVQRLYRGCHKGIDPYVQPIPKNCLMHLHGSPGVRDNCDDSLVKILFSHTAPVHKDTHALRLHSGHDVKLVPIERESHHRHTVINCLKYAIHPTVADEGFHVGMACRQRNSSRSVPSMLKQGYWWLLQDTAWTRA